MASSGISVGVALRGAQDVYLMSSKESTFFRAEYSRHTNFGFGEIRQSTDTTAAFGRNNIQTSITRSGDLLGELYLTYTLAPFVYTAANPMTVVDGAQAKYNSNFAHYTNGVGYAAIQEISCRIGQHEFDKQNGEIMFLREQLSAKADRQISESVGYLVNSPDMHVALSRAALMPQQICVPVQFWFARHVEQCLPLIALFWHDAMIYMNLRSMAQLVERSITFVANALPTPAGPTDIMFLGNFYFLDKPERAVFGNSKQELVFSQIQFFGDQTVAAANTQLSMNIRYNHPVTDLTFVLQMNSATDVLPGSTYNVANNQWLNFNGPEFVAGNALTPTAAATLSVTAVSILMAEPAQWLQIFLNNQQRTEQLNWLFCREIIPARNYTRIPREAHCAVYSFGIDADNLLSSGTVNFSRLDTAEARIQLWGSSAIPGVVAFTMPVGTAATTCSIGVSGGLGWAGRATSYARNFNLAKVSLGMMGVRFAA